MRGAPVCVFKICNNNNNNHWLVCAETLLDCAGSMGDYSVVHAGPVVVFREKLALVCICVSDTYLLFAQVQHLLVTRQRAAPNQKRTGPHCVG